MSLFKLTLATAIFSVCLPAAAEAATPYSSASKKAYARLKEIDTFCWDMHESVNSKSPVYSFRVLCKDRDADALFKQLLKEARLAGQMYALCGLWFTDPVAFAVAVEPYRHSKEQINVLRVIVEAKEPVSEFVEHHGAAAVRLNNNKDTCKAWMKRNPNAGGMEYDIIGGGLPCAMRDDGGF
ncbi:MAG: hypothetical protein KDK97_17025 [Verrucomicrobiales bacterium]|nr:hypothetical protein [Verrucomicrobiales bacterium]MCP5559671.1 hypothetical protein [Verrucomicrobiaceae bacterium]